MATTHDEEAAPELVDLLVIGRELMDQARAGNSGRASRTLIPARDRSLRHVLLALVAGSALGEHRAPPAASLQVLVGAAHLRWGQHELEVLAGGWTAIPPMTHDLVADQDTIALLTVASDPRDVGTDDQDG